MHITTPLHTHERPWEHRLARTVYRCWPGARALFFGTWGKRRSSTTLASGMGVTDSDHPTTAAINATETTQILAHVDMVAAGSV